MATPPTWKQIGENLVRYRGGKIYLRAKVGGKVVRKSLGTADVRIAKIKRDAELEKLRAAEEAGGTGDAGIPATVGEALELVGKRVVNAAGLKPKTVRYYGQLFQTLRDTLPLDAVGASWSADGVAAWWKAYSGAQHAERVAAVAHGLHRPQRGADAAGERMAGLGVDQVTQKHSTVSGRRDEGFTIAGVAKAAMRAVSLSKRP